jgi:hypothetical protein
VVIVVIILDIEIVRHSETWEEFWTGVVMRCPGQKGGGYLWLATTAQYSQQPGPFSVTAEVDA